MGEEFEVHGQHDHAVEHAAHGGDGLGRAVAMFTAVLACIGAVVSYQNGASESRGLELKNDAILHKSEASDQWAYYQAKGIKQVVLEHAAGATPAEREANAAEARRYASEKEEIKKHAEELEHQSKEAGEASEHAFLPHPSLAQALAFVQVAIALAALTVLTRQRWLLALAGGSAAVGVGYWIHALMLH